MFYIFLLIGQLTYILKQSQAFDHAGELGAVQICKGQLAVLGRSDVAPKTTFLHFFFRRLLISMVADP